MNFIIESTFAHIFLFIEQLLQQETNIFINLHQQLVLFEYIVLSCFVLFLS